MPDWLEGLLKVIGAVALILGPTVAVYGHRLLRHTGTETVAVTRENAELAAITARLAMDMESLRARADSTEKALAVYQAYAEGQAKLVDTEREARHAAELREADCVRRLTASDERQNLMEARLLAANQRIAGLERRTGVGADG